MKNKYTSKITSKLIKNKRFRKLIGKSVVYQSKTEAKYAKGVVFKKIKRKK